MFAARTSFWLPLMAVTLAAVGFGFLLGRERADLRELGWREAAELQRLQRLNQEWEALLEERGRLLTDPAAVAKVAREQYEYAAPGEIALPFEPAALEPVPAPLPAAKDTPGLLLGNGSYPWVVPVAAFALSVLVLSALEGISLWRRKAASTARGEGM